MEITCLLEELAPSDSKIGRIRRGELQGWLPVCNAVVKEGLIRAVDGPARTEQRSQRNFDKPAVATPDHGLSVVGQSIGKAESRGKVQFVGYVKIVAQPRL